MSRSSAALKPSSAASNRFSALTRLASLPFLAATQEALPWSFVGLLAAFAAALPFVNVPGPIVSPTLGLRVSGALLPAFGVMGLVLVVVLSVRYARRAALPAIPSVAAPVAAFLTALPPLHGGILPYLRVVGPSGLFLAFAACGIYALAARASRNAWIGALVVVLLALGLRAAHADVPAAVTAMLGPLGHLGDTYAALMLIVLIETLLWCIGMHGPALLAAVVTPVYLTMQMQNTQAFAHHQPLPHLVVVSLFLFIFPGGAGSTLPLAALLAFSKVPRLRTVGRATIVPALFNTNEPLLFATPVVLNPYLIAPFVIAPLVLASTTYAAVAAGWVGRAIYYVPSSIPTLISTYVATLDVRAVALTLVNVAIATAIYFPFVRAYERHAGLPVELAA
jgi:cellobiose-specific phosphotransferase system component IIC